MIDSGSVHAGGGSIPLVSVVDQAANLARTDDLRVYVVGGIVRDILSHGRIGDADLDLVVEGDGIRFAHTLSRSLGGVVKEHASFRTAKLIAPFRASIEPFKELSQDLHCPLSEVDVASARSEGYPRPGALPVVSFASIEKDLFRRDFSINAIAIAVSDFLRFCHGRSTVEELAGQVVDPCGGLLDLKEGKLRILHDGSFVDDPTRLFRAVRYLSRLSLELEQKTERMLSTAVQNGVLSSISTRRIWNELVACGAEKGAAGMVRMCCEWGLFERTPFNDTSFSSHLPGVLERFHALGLDLRISEQVETVLAATVLRYAAPSPRTTDSSVDLSDSGRLGKIKELQLPRPLQRKALAVASDTPLESEAPVDAQLISALRSVVAGSGS